MRWVKYLFPSGFSIISIHSQINQYNMSDHCILRQPNLPSTNSCLLLHKLSLLYKLWATLHSRMETEFRKQKEKFKTAVCTLASKLNLTLFF